MAMELIVASPLSDIIELSCDISCAELLRLQIQNQGVIVLYSLYRDAILACLSIALRKTLTASTISSPCIASIEELSPYNIMIQSTKPLGLRHYKAHTYTRTYSAIKTSPNSSLSLPCPGSIAILSSELQLTDVNQIIVLKAAYSDIHAVELEDRICKVALSSPIDKQPYQLFLRGISPFVSTFVYILIRMQLYLSQNRSLSLVDDDTLFIEEECIAEKAALVQSVASPEKRISISSDDSDLLLANPRPLQIFDLIMDPRTSENKRHDSTTSLCSRAVNSLQAMKSIEETFGSTHRRFKSEPRTPEQSDVSTIIKTSAPRFLPRSSSAKSFANLSKCAKRTPAYFYDSMNDTYISATIASTHQAKHPSFSVSIFTAGTSYNITLDYIFQGFDFVSNFLCTHSKQPSHRFLGIIEAAKAEYSRNYSRDGLLKPVILLSESHSLGIIPLLLNVQDAQNLCLQFSVLLFTSSNDPHMTIAVNSM